MNKTDIAEQQSDFILYTGNDGEVNVNVFVQDETVWLTQKAIAELFGVQVPAINKHLKNIFEVGELEEKSVISILETTALDHRVVINHLMNIFIDDELEENSVCACFAHTA